MSVSPPFDLDQTVVLSRHAELKVRAEGEILVMPERAMRLRGSSAEILRVCSEPRTGREVLATLCERYPEDPELGQVVSAFLAEMLALGALER